jgi:hypothetical protein
MSHLYLSTETYDPISAAIRAETGVDWSHVGFRDDSGRTFSAMFRGGVAWRPPNPEAGKILLLDVDGCDAALAKAQTQAGDDYDMLNILGIALRHDWSMPGHFICDKLVFWAFQQTDNPLVNPTFIQIEKLTPRDVLLSLKVRERHG